MATYNGERFLREQLDSLYSQTMQPDEVIVVDDCSKDGTVNILEEYHKSHGLRYVVNEYNLGVNKNFEKALKLCTGDYIMFCDQDDVWMDNKIEIHYKKMQEIEEVNLPCLVTSRNTFVDKNLNIHHTTELDKDTDDYRDTILYHLSQGSAMMMNRKCLDYIFPIPDYNIGICYDIHIGYIVAMTGKKYNLKESLMYYRVHDNNVTVKPDTFIKHKSSFRRYRETSIVPMNMIKCFKNTNKSKRADIPCNRMRYVEKIIAISEEKNPICLLWLLITTPKIPIRNKIRSLYSSVLNIILLS